MAKFHVQKYTCIAYPQKTAKKESCFATVQYEYHLAHGKMIGAQEQSLH